jgi:hypothetical protein
MYPLPISMIALIAGASLHINSAAAETDVPRLPDIIPPLELSEEDTPPESRSAKTKSRVPRELRVAFREN